MLLRCRWFTCLALLACCCCQVSLCALTNTSSTWAVIVNASRFWLNYRHTANAMTLYHSLKRLGMPDSRIILMHADCATCDPRTYRPGKTFYRPNDVYLDSDTDVEIDYRDMEVNAESVMRVLTGNVGYGAASSQVLGSDSESNVLLFLTGHGGDSFLKFHDQSELMAADLGAAVEYMTMVGMCKRVLVVLDTCQASTMYEDIRTHGWAGAASSKRDQSSYALNSDSRVGTFLIDEFSHHMFEFLKRNKAIEDGATFDDMISYIMSRKMSSEVQFDQSRSRNVALKDFFVPHVQAAQPVSLNNHRSWQQQQQQKGIASSDVWRRTLV